MNDDGPGLLTPQALPFLALVAFPVLAFACAIDWLADRKYAGILSHVDGLTRRIIGRPGLCADRRESVLFHLAL